MTTALLYVLVKENSYLIKVKVHSNESIYNDLADNADENIISKLIDETTISASIISEITPDVLRRFVSNISINSNGDVENIDFNFD